MSDLAQTSPLQAYLSALTRASPPMRLRLDHLLPLADRLALRQFPCPVITVAGTNGKGSVVALLAAAYRAMGLRVASTTSPHLMRVNERACINGQAISDEALLDALRQIEACRERVVLTYFEHLTLAILWFFKAQQADVLLLEVGLGGRLDATNVVDCDCAVITSIALDHMAYLGETREAIAAEKCGIFRPGCLVVSGDMAPPDCLAKRAQALGCKLLQQGVDFGHQATDGQMRYQLPNGLFFKCPLPVLNAQNLATAMAVIDQMAPRTGFASWPKLAPLLSRTALLGRQQRIKMRNGVTLWLDVAHNPAGAACLLDALHATPTTGETWMLFGVLASKDYQAMVKVFSGLPAKWLVAPAVSQGAVVSQKLTVALREAGMVVESEADSLSVAFTRALRMAKSGDRIVAWGSFHVVSEVLSVIEGVGC